MKNNVLQFTKLGFIEVTESKQNKYSFEFKIPYNNMEGKEVMSFQKVKGFLAMGLIPTDVPITIDPALEEYLHAVVEKWNREGSAVSLEEFKSFLES